MKIVILSVFLLFLGIISVNTVNAQVVSSTPTFQTIDLSSTPVPNDFPYGITCDDSAYTWMTIHGQGKLVRIAKSDRSVTLFDNIPSSGSGREWYSVVYEPNSDDLFVNERDNGLVLRYDKSSDTWTNIPIVSNFDSPDNPNISYPSTYSVEPAIIRLNEATHGQHTYDLSTGSFGEMKLANGYVWVVLNYSWDFDSEGEAILSDQSFNGIVRINPTDNTITNYAISGSSALRGITTDATDSTILWITDNVADRVYKFNTNTNTVTQTITLDANTKARGIANDDTNLYVAMNESGGSGNSKILQINKSTLVKTVIDTSAVNSVGGSFSVFVVGSNIIWTDQSGHYGSFSRADPVNSAKSVTTTSGQTSSNHFGCVVGTEFWFAGQGSAKVGSFSLSGSSESSHGDSCMGDCYSPHFGTDENGKEFYNDGLTLIAQNFTKIINIPNVLHVLGNETINIPVGQPINFTLKAMDSYPDQIESCEIAFGLQRGHFVKQDAEFILGVKRTFDGIVSTYEEGNKNAYRAFDATIENRDKYVFCKFVFTPTYYLPKDMFAIQAIDIHQYDGIYFVNEGIFFRGMSEIGTPIFDYMDDDGILHTLTILDQTLENTSIAIDEDGNHWFGDFGKLWTKEFVRPDITGSLSKYHGYDRNDYFEFKAYKLGQELIAKMHPDYGFDSSLIQKQVKPSFAYDIENPYPRGWDSVPNMMKAVGEYEKSKLTNIVK